MNLGIVARGFSAAHIPGRSAYTSISGSRWSLIPLTSTLRAQLCCHVFLPCCKAVGEGMVDSGLFVATERTAGVHVQSPVEWYIGNVSVPALRRKDNCPARGPCVILFHTWFASSSSTTATAYSLQP